MKKIKFTAVLFLLLITFFSCKKNVSTKLGNEINEENVNNWLSKKVSKNGLGKTSSILKSIKENLNFSISWTCEFQNEKSMIIIPIKNDYLFVNNKNKKVSNYLVVFKSSENKILYANIWQAHNNATVSKNTFANIYLGKNEELNGRYTELSLQDNFIRENLYDNNKLKETNLRKVKPSTNALNSGTLVCLDYYVLRTTYQVETGIIISQVVLYEFQVCNCKPTNMVQTTIIAESDCDPSAGVGATPADELIQMVTDALSGSVTTTTTYNSHYCPDVNQTTHFSNFLIGSGTYYSVNAVSQFQTKRTGSYLNVIHNITTVSYTTNFPYVLEYALEGKYIPNEPSLNVNIDYNNTNHPWATAIRSGKFAVTPKAPGFSWCGNSFSIQGNCYNDFYPQ